MSINILILSYGYVVYVVVYGYDDYEYYDIGGNIVFGFWVYLMSDCFIFVLLFVIYVVLVGGIDGGFIVKDLFELLFVVWEIVLLLILLLIFGLGMIVMYCKQMGQMYLWLGIIWLLGFGFMCMEVWEFQYLIYQGYGLDCSVFLLVFFVLVGIYGLYVSVGLLWFLVMFVQLKKYGLILINKICMVCLSLFWYFLDLIWIGVFFVVYFNGVL